MVGCQTDEFLLWLASLAPTAEKADELEQVVTDVWRSLYAMAGCSN
jgi:hypothetical protein